MRECVSGRNNLEAARRERMLSRDVTNRSEGEKRAADGWKSDGSSMDRGDVEGMQYQEKRERGGGARRKNTRRGKQVK